eukprot:TRINITY_DN37414_c0_g1_i1.p1 TRINITY_DN37414_c0_g1~~TRINITY_DN37414_c0_g1_i1.p1  ORF type:complete len:514 (-),score=75.86 TRINITY_DN37414_c0_g1_i1:426-1937(-)
MVLFVHSCSRPACPVVKIVDPAAGRCARAPSVFRKASNVERSEDNVDLSQTDQRLLPGLQVREIAAFCGPALTVPLADPLMTLIDTACVGRMSGTLELAALGPNTVIFNFLNYGFTFMGIATMSIVARELAECQRESAARSMGHAVALAVFLGVALTALLRSCAPYLLAVAGAGASSEFFNAAGSYLRVRALSAPAMMVAVVAQSALLAQRESWTPAIAVLTAATVNALGDIFLVVGLDMGVAGAAWATVVGEYFAAGLLLACLPRNGRLPLKVRMPRRRKDFAPFGSIFGPLLIFKLSKNLCYGLLQSTATALGAVACAAHQSVWVLWTLLAFVPEPLSQAAQSLLPARFVAAERGGQPEQIRLRQSVRLLIAMALMLGVGLGLVSAALPVYVPQLLAKDPELHAAVASVAPPAGLAALLASIGCPVEGALLAQRELRFMAAAMVAIFLVLCLAMRTLRAQAGARGAGALASVWWGLVLFFALRLAIMAPRLRRAVLKERGS